MKPFEFVVAAILGVFAIPIVLWSYSHFMQVTGSGAYGPGIAVTGSPSISASQVDTILCKNNSPACGTGYTLYSYGTQYGIDPAFALAVFSHESGFGKSGIAAQTKSLGNIRCSDGYACIGGFRAYSSWESSYSDFYKLIAGPSYVGSGLTTPEAILAKYAPTADNNDPVAYAADVESSMKDWRAA